jgi:hypothetical protein
MSVRIVIFDKGEDLSWTKNVHHKSVVYRDMAGKSEAFLHHIVTNYNSLDDVTVFLQGDPFPYLHNLVGFRRPSDTEIKIVCDKINKEITPTSLFAAFYQMIHNNQNGDKGIDMGFYCREYYDVNYDYFTTVEGSQYIVPKQNILARPLAFWEKLYKGRLDEGVQEQLWWLAFKGAMDPGFKDYNSEKISLHFSVLNTPYINWKMRIQDEISRNGNANLISESGLPDNAQIYAIGDSHTIFFYNSLKIREHWGYCFKIPLTVYSLLKNPFNVYKVGTMLGNGHEKYNVKAGDFVLFYYGFNDVQKQVHHHARHRWREEINDLFTRYMELINVYRHAYKIHPIIVTIYPNPHPNAVGTDTEGTFRERRMYTEEANKLLRQLCAGYSMQLLDIYDYITDETGFIKEEFTKDRIHLDYDNDVLRIVIDNMVGDICHKVLGTKC